MYTLMDGEERNAAHPDTFEIPSLEDREGVLPGTTVKLGFEVKDKDLAGERMWVEVTAVDGDQFTGTIANDPIVIDGKYGDPVSFEPKNILSIWEEEEDQQKVDFFDNLNGVQDSSN